MSALPQEARLTPPLNTAAAAELAALHPLRILLVEDNVMNQKVALRMLERLGYRTDVATNGQEAVEALQRQTYGVVLMDVQMPVMDGLEATRRIRQQWPRERQPRIIAMTANVMYGDREECLAVGMDDYLGKPVRLEDLIRALSQLPTPAEASEEALRPLNKEAAAATVLDHAPLDELRAIAGAETSSVLGELLDIFFSDTPRLLADLRQAADADDALALHHAAHTLKSTSASLGARVLSQLSAELETDARTGRLKDPCAKVTRLAAEYESVKRALTLYVQNAHISR
ncbi:MAG TPA: response regulator [Anaerolineae bacterium]|nr:response regulator [Anaerolineae bacterium]